MIAALHRAGHLSLLAADMATARVRRAGPSRDRTLRRIVSRLGLMHGLPQKIGQLMSFAEFDDDHAKFSPLTEASVAMPAAQAFEEMERQLERPLSDCFAWVDRTAIAASIGQVHAARLHDGRTVAIKIQYPGIADHVEWDLRALGWLTQPVGGLQRGFNVDAYRAEVGEMLRRELDYNLEAENIRQFAAWIADCPGVVVPQVIDEFSRKRILTMTWVPGENPTAARSWTPDQRRNVADTLLEVFLRSCFSWGCVHADPHAGNLRVRRTLGAVTVGLIDFGCLKPLPLGFTAATAGLIHDGLRGNRDADQIMARFAAMGFSPAAMQPMQTALPDVAEVLARPFATNEPFEVREWNISARLAKILGEHRMAFRLAGPPEMIFFLRAFHGLLKHLAALDAPVSWREKFERLAPPEPSRAVAVQEEHRRMKSETLHIEVTDSGQPIVALTFAAHATEHLADLVPNDLRQRITARAIDLRAIADDAQRREFAPGELFALQDGSKQVRVWLS